MALINSVLIGKYYRCCCWPVVALPSPSSLLRFTLSASFSSSSSSTAPPSTVKSFQQIPGPTLLPLIGNMWRYLPVIGQYKLEQMDQNSRYNLARYGPIVREEISSQHRIVHLFDPKDIESMFQQEGRYPNRRSHRALLKYRHERPEIYRSGGLFPENGSEWARLRNQFKRHFLLSKNINQYDRRLSTIGDDLVRYVREVRRDSETLEVEDMQQDLYRWALESICAIMLDVRMGCLDRHEDHNIKDHNIKDHNIKDHNIKDHNIKDHNIKDHNIKDHNIKDHYDKDDNIKDHNIKDHNIKDHYDKDDNIKDHNIKDHNIKDHYDKDDNIKDHNIKDHNIKDHNIKDHYDKDDNIKDHNIKDHNIKDHYDKDHNIKEHNIKDHYDKDHNIKEQSSDAERLIEAAHLTIDAVMRTELHSGWETGRPTKDYRKLVRGQNVMAEIVNKHLQRQITLIETAQPDQDQCCTLLRKFVTDPKIDRKDLFAIILDFVLAGIDTTSITAGFVLYYLAKSPEIQEQVRKEILATVGHCDATISAQQFGRMPLLKASVKETMRLRPISIGVGRLTSEPMLIANYRIPANTMLITQNQTSCRQERYFGEADQFRPERWLHTTSKLDQHRFLWLPFGHGTRMCLGRRIAELELYMVLAKVLVNFRVEYRHEDIGIKTSLINVPDRAMRFRLVDL